MPLAETLRDRRILMAVAGWTLLNVLLAWGAAGLTEAAGIAWEAHLGGFYAGLLLYGFFDRPPPPVERRCCGCGIGPLRTLLKSNTIAL